MVTRDKKKEGDFCQVWAALLVGNKHMHGKVLYFSVRSGLKRFLFSVKTKQSKNVNFHRSRQANLNIPLFLPMLADEKG